MVHHNILITKSKLLQIFKSSRTKNQQTMVLTQLPLDLSNQTILDVTRGIYKDALAVKHVQVCLSPKIASISKLSSSKWSFLTWPFQDDDTDEYECLWCDENEVACQQKFTSMSEFVNHINYAHMNDENTDYICMWKGCSRRTPGAKSCAFKGKVYRWSS